ncbi:Ig-like domain-containing protein [Streptomyces sp. NBC_00562]|uniref:L,D-transpeptidase n=1 Tax=Streptomyces sp. NBC_00562 TaxID=2975777 RepID=UPI002E81D923|nr:Ig-like domain-containing protein [Streptomyces sp. NBC_00562]WUC17529.1 Ig-like domain-containing protein [Streptomyces sp. NBC_00562]WUC25138.1 Ig-like domain-containing protein [Streptomyces sp. NBC_00562]
MHRTRPVPALAVLSISACLLAGCSNGPGEAIAPAEASPAAARVTVSPRIHLNAVDGQRHVSVGRGGRVTVRAGTVTKVSLATADGRAVRGESSPDKRTWAPDAPLAHDTAYRLTVVAANGDGREETKRIAFTTLAGTDRFTGTFTPDNGSTVGVGMPVSFTFDKAITDKKAVESAIEVTSSSGQPVVGHWFGAQRLDFRPQQYWKAHSTVTARIRLDGVKGAEGAYGEQDRTVRFTVGRSQVSTVDAAAHRMTVVQDGKALKTLPITAGAKNSPTWNGRMVISEKLITTRMDGATVGFAGQYDIPDVPHAMRLSTSGTFIHGNYWGEDSVFGRSNISHGCVGLNDAQGGSDPDQDAAWFYNHSLVGDVVVVQNSNDRTIAPDNGLNGWNMPWKQWKAGSAR